MDSHPAWSWRARCSALCLPLLIVLPALASASPQGPPAVVRVDSVRQEVVTQKKTVTGDVRASRRVAVATKEKGIVRELRVREGQVVKAKDVLASLDSQQLELDLRVIESERTPVEAAIAERSSDVQAAERDVRSLKALIERDAANPKELEDAQSVLTAAQARVRESQAELKVLDARAAKLQQRVEDMVIRAPFDGTVVGRSTEVGAWVSEGASVVDLLSTADLEVWLEVPQDLYAAVQAGAGAIDVEVAAMGKSFQMKTYRVIPDIDRRARAFRLVGAASAEFALAPGMSVIAQVPTGKEREMTTIHRDAILRNDLGSYVYSVLPAAEGEAPAVAPVQVEILFQTADRSVVRAGRLRPGSQIVIEGNERLYPMAKVAPIPASGEADGR